jgi:hypothetical protein
MALSQRVWSQVAPGATQMPQLTLQQTSPRLQVLGPHRALCVEKLRVGGATGSVDCMLSLAWGGAALPPAPFPPVPPRLPPTAAGVAALEAAGIAVLEAAGIAALEKDGTSEGGAAGASRAGAAGDGALVGTTGGTTGGYDAANVPSSCQPSRS